MADQQDHTLSGGSVEKASASADTSKPRGKSNGGSGNRKRQSSVISASVEEKRRRQAEEEVQSQQPTQNTSTHKRHTADSNRSEGKARGERKSNGAGLTTVLGKSFPFLFCSNIFCIQYCNFFERNKKLVKLLNNNLLTFFKMNFTLQRQTGSSNRKHNRRAVVLAAAAQGYGAQQSRIFTS